MLAGKKTYIGICVILLGVAFRNAGIEVGDGELTQAVSLAAELIGIAFSIYGRYKAQPSSQPPGVK